jgi:hypothetical protein
VVTSPEDTSNCVSIQVTTFTRADANSDTAITMSDAIFTLQYLYVPESADPTCMDAADSDDNGVIEMADAIFTLKHLYVPESPEPPAPGPESCGPDPTPDGLECEIHPCMGRGLEVRHTGSSVR